MRMRKLTAAAVCLVAQALLLVAVSTAIVLADDYGSGADECPNSACDETRCAMNNSPCPNVNLQYCPCQCKVRNGIKQCFPYMY